MINKSRSLTLIISNTGGEPLTITDFTLSDPVNFSFDYNSGAIPCQSTYGYTIPSTESCTGTVTFNPHVEAIFNQTLTIHSNDPDNPNYAINLSGRSGIDSDGDNVIDVEEAGDATMTARLTVSRQG